MINRVPKKKHKKKLKFPTTTKLPKKGDVWWVLYPYTTKGNMEKIRPSLVSDVNEEKEIYICRQITTNSKRGERITGRLEKCFDRPSYITKVYMKLTLDKFYKRIYASKENK